MISSLMWADHMPDFVLKVLKDTFERLTCDEDKESASSPPCRQPHHGLQRCLSDNGSCYITVLDSPTGEDNNMPWFHLFVSELPTHVKISHLVASLPTNRQQVVFALIVPSCQQVFGISC